MVRTALTTVLIGSAMLLAACNTVRGLGSDVSSAANATENVMH